MDVKTVRFHQSVGWGWKDSTSKYRKKKGKRKARGMNILAFPHKQAAAVYNALASSDRENEIVNECNGDKVVAWVVREALDKLVIWKYPGMSIKALLKRLQDKEKKRLEDNADVGQVTQANIEQVLSTDAIERLLNVVKRFPELTKDEESSLGSDGVVDIPLDEDVPDVELVRRHTMQAAFRMAKSRGLDRDDFKEIALSIFKDAAFPGTFDAVVAFDYEPSLVNSAEAGTVQSDKDNIHMAASNACAQWCRAAGKDSTKFFLAVFKV